MTDAQEDQIMEAGLYFIALLEMVMYKYEER
jgi:hypothetical protein